MTSKPKKTGKDRIDVGDQVIHAKFGVGTVLHKIGDGEEAKLTVAFPEEGQKKLLAKFAKLKRVRGGKAVEEDEEEEVAAAGKSLLDAAREKVKDEDEDEEVEIEEIGDDDEEEEADVDKDIEDEEVEEMYDDDEEEEEEEEKEYEE